MPPPRGSAQIDRGGSSSGVFGDCGPPFKFVIHKGSLIHSSPFSFLKGLRKHRHGVKVNASDFVAMGAFFHNIHVIVSPVEPC